MDDLTDETVFETCGRCHRKTWAESEFGQEDRMTQPDDGVVFRG